MSYLDDWTKLKADFRAGNDAIAREIKKIKASIKAEKKANADQDAIDSLEEVLAQSVVLTKKKTGFSQVLPAYEKLLDKMEALIAKGVPASDRKVWEPFVKALATLKPANEKATQAVRKDYGQWIERAGRSEAKYAKAYKVMGKDLPKYLAGRNKPAHDLIIGIEAIQRKIAARLNKIWLYLEAEMKHW